MQQARTLCERDRVKIIKRGQAAGKNSQQTRRSATPPATGKPSLSPNSLNPSSTSRLLGDEGSASRLRSVRPDKSAGAAPAAPFRHNGLFYTSDREGRRIDPPQHIEIDKAIVERRDQRVRHGRGETA